MRPVRAQIGGGETLPSYVARSQSVKLAAQDPSLPIFLAVAISAAWAIPGPEPTPPMPACPAPCSAVAGVNAKGETCAGTDPPALSQQELRRVVFAEEAGEGAVTVGSLFSSCSYNKSRLTPQTSTVAKTVQLPCSVKKG